MSFLLSLAYSHAHSYIQYTTDLESASRLKSVTQERDLEEFLNTAQLAGTEFTAGTQRFDLSFFFYSHLSYVPERRNVKIIQSTSTHNPYLLTEAEEQSTLKKHQANKQRLRVPRRPPWTKTITTAQLDRQEKDAFLDWRRGLAQYVHCPLSSLGITWYY